MEAGLHFRIQAGETVTISSTSVLTGPSITYGDGARIEILVEQAAAASPDAPALRFLGHETRFADLVSEASGIASDLAALGVRQGDIVAVRMKRRPRMVAVLLAVLKCRAIYSAIPLDWPDARYTQVVGQADVRLCVTDDPGTPEVAGILRVDDTTLTGTSAGTGPAPTGPGSPSDPCCVFFTSGSTGIPKAVLAPHAGVIRIARDPRLALGRNTVMLQSAPVGWDAFALELWGPLIHGGTAVLQLTAELTALDIKDAVAQGMNTLFLTTTLFNAVSEDAPEALSGLQLLMTGGERISPHHVAELRRRYPEVRLFHCYGPVECTIFTTVHEIGIPGSEIPIGTPVAGTAVYLLDDDRKPAEPGHVGEIAVAGDGLALGYLGHDEEQRKRFPVLCVGREGNPVRLYLTGDLGRIDEQGELVFLGRLDRQVKIRGVRIEPGEVERVIERVPGVTRVAVLALPLDEPRKARLVAYFTASDGTTVHAEQVRDAVRAALPGAFVPDTVIAVPAMPTMANGKLDESRLAVLAERSPAPDAGRDRPSGSPPLRALVSRVSELLGHPVDPDTDIFDAGGTSITAIQIAHTVERLWATRISAADVLRARTPAALELLAGQQRPGTSQVTKSNRWLGGLPAPAYRFWYLERHQPGIPNGLVPLPYRLRGDVDASALARALQVVVSWHEALRTRYEPGREVKAHVIDGDALPPILETASRLPLPAAEERLREFLRRPFDLSSDIPVRALIVPSDGDSSLLTMAFHHIAVDAWSLKLFTEDLSTAYRLLKSGTPLPQREPSRFIETWRQQAARESQEDQDQLNAWTDEVAGVPDLPLGGSGRLAPSAPTEEQWIELPAGLARAAQRAARMHGGTAVAVLLAAWVRALREFTGASDFALGMPVAGRLIPEAEMAVGCFTSAVIPRFRGDHQPPEVDIKAAAEQLGLTLRFQYMPIERVWFRDPPPDTGRNPFCQVGFVVQNTPPAQLRIGGVSYEREYPPRERSAYELTLEVWWSPQLRARIWHRTDVLNAAEAARLAALWREEALSLADWT